MSNDILLTWLLLLVGGLIGCCQLLIRTEILVINICECIDDFVTEIYGLIDGPAIDTGRHSDHIVIGITGKVNNTPTNSTEQVDNSITNYARKETGMAIDNGRHIDDLVMVLNGHIDFVINTQ